MALVELNLVMFPRDDHVRRVLLTPAGVRCAKDGQRLTDGPGLGY